MAEAAHNRLASVLSSAHMDWGTPRAICCTRCAASGVVADLLACAVADAGMPASPAGIDPEQLITDFVKQFRAVVG